MVSGRKLARSVAELLRRGLIFVDLLRPPVASGHAARLQKYMSRNGERGNERPLGRPRETTREALSGKGERASDLGHFRLIVLLATLLVLALGMTFADGPLLASFSLSVG